LFTLKRGAAKLLPGHPAIIAKQNDIYGKMNQEEKFVHEERHGDRKAETL
jgi:hypothetical protein